MSYMSNGGWLDRRPDLSGVEGSGDRPDPCEAFRISVYFSYRRGVLVATRPSIGLGL
jgi:hypothetical protein